MIFGGNSKTMENMTLKERFQKLKLGDRLNFFDDGKIGESRRYRCTIIDLYDLSDKKEYSQEEKNLLKLFEYNKEINKELNIYDDNPQYFIVIKLVKPSWMNKLDYMQISPIICVKKKNSDNFYGLLNLPYDPYEYSNGELDICNIFKKR